MKREKSQERLERKKEREGERAIELLVHVYVSRDGRMNWRSETYAS